MKNHKLKIVVKSNQLKIKLNCAATIKDVYLVKNIINRIQLYEKINSFAVITSGSRKKKECIESFWTAVEGIL